VAYEKRPPRTVRPNVDLSTGKAIAMPKRNLRIVEAERRWTNSGGNMILESITHQGTDFKIESGIAIARRQSKAERDEADENTTPENISGWEKKNRSGTEKEVGENQGRQEIGKFDLVRVPTPMWRAFGDSRRNPFSIAGAVRNKIAT
jgi:hypothetical protein